MKDINKELAPEHKGKIIHIEKTFHKGRMFFGNKKRRLIFFVTLLIVDFILILFLFIGNTSFTLGYFFILLMYLFLIFLCTSLLLSMKIVYLTIYENGINYPYMFFNYLRKEKIFFINDIETIFWDKKDMYIQIKSGKKYKYSSYIFTDQLYPIIKKTFYKFHHVKIIEPTVKHRN
ncbi:MAG: hypothetical protein JSW00_07035 [Thermoplasmata archaeon]|nr:MAG: hypothetical protein JSW00_07035 [Thermoplasmata archaeon]